LVERRNKETKELFLGCERYPECPHTEEIPIDQRLRAMGAKPLPGLG